MRHIAFFRGICGKQAFCPCFVSFTQLRRISQNPKQITVRIKAILLRRFNQTVDHAAGLRLLLKSLIFRTGNGDHFRRVTCLHFSVSMQTLYRKARQKASVFNGFHPFSLLRQLVNGSSSNCCWTRRARPSMPLRRSV